MATARSDFSFLEPESFGDYTDPVFSDPASGGTAPTGGAPAPTGAPAPAPTPEAPGPAPDPAADQTGPAIPTEEDLARDARNEQRLSGQPQGAPPPAPQIGRAHV